jgi:TPR repeat protein
VTFKNPKRAIKYYEAAADEGHALAISMPHYE